MVIPTLCEEIAGYIERGIEGIFFVSMTIQAAVVLYFGFVQVMKTFSKKDSYMKWKATT